MRRSAGVTLAAVLALLGSLVLLGFGVLMLVVMSVAGRSDHSPLEQVPRSFLLVMFVLIYFAPAISGIVTSIGLFRLRNWARISILIFSGLLAFMAVCSILGTLFIPFPASAGSGANPAIVTGVKVVLASFWTVLAAICIWWLVLFTRVGVKAQFVPPTALAADGLTTVPAEPKRPVSITVIAWIMIVCNLFLPIYVWIHFPAVLFTAVLTGWKASLFYAVIACLNIAVGIGLLRLNSLARNAAIAIFVFGFINATVFFLMPGAADRTHAMLDQERAVIPWMKVAPEFPGAATAQPSLAFGALMGLAFVLVPLYFLYVNRRVFEDGLPKTP
jgi:hypothetical protein